MLGVKPVMGWCPIQGGVNDSPLFCTKETIDKHRPYDWRKILLFWYQRWKKLVCCMPINALNNSKTYLLPHLIGHRIYTVDSKFNKRNQYLRKIEWITSPKLFKYWFHFSDRCKLSETMIKIWHLQFHILPISWDMVESQNWVLV